MLQILFKALKSNGWIFVSRSGVLVGRRAAVWDALEMREKLLSAICDVDRSAVVDGAGELLFAFLSFKVDLQFLEVHHHRCPHLGLDLLDLAPASELRVAHRWHELRRNRLNL